MSLESSLVSASSAAFGAPKGGVTVDVDLTFLWPIVTFVVLITVLRPVLFEPMLKLFEERERRIDGAKAAARKMDEVSAEALGKYEAEMKQARAAGNAEREAQRALGQQAEAEIVAKVREATASTMAEGRRKLQAEADQARAALRSESRSLAAMLASRVLGREVRG